MKKRLAVYTDFVKSRTQQSRFKSIVDINPIDNIKKVGLIKDRDTLTINDNIIEFTGLYEENDIGRGIFIRDDSITEIEDLGVILEINGYKYKRQYKGVVYLDWFGNDYTIGLVAALKYGKIKCVLGKEYNLEFNTTLGIVIKNNVEIDGNGSIFKITHKGLSNLFTFYFNTPIEYFVWNDSKFIFDIDIFALFYRSYNVKFLDLYTNNTFPTTVTIKEIPGKSGLVQTGLNKFDPLTFDANAYALNTGFINYQVYTYNFLSKPYDQELYNIGNDLVTLPSTNDMSVESEYNLYLISNPKDTGSSITDYIVGLLSYVQIVSNGPGSGSAGNSLQAWMPGDYSEGIGAYYIIILPMMNDYIEYDENTCIKLNERAFVFLLEYTLEAASNPRPANITIKDNCYILPFKCKQSFEQISAYKNYVYLVQQLSYDAPTITSLPENDVIAEIFEANKNQIIQGFGGNFELPDGSIIDFIAEEKQDTTKKLKSGEMFFDRELNPNFVTLYYGDPDVIRLYSPLEADFFIKLGFRYLDVMEQGMDIQGNIINIKNPDTPATQFTEYDISKLPATNGILMDTKPAKITGEYTFTDLPLVTHTEIVGDNDFVRLKDLKNFDVNRNVMVKSIDQIVGGNKTLLNIITMPLATTADQFCIKENLSIRNKEVYNELKQYTLEKAKEIGLIKDYVEIYPVGSTYMQFINLDTKQFELYETPDYIFGGVWKCLTDDKDITSFANIPGTLVNEHIEETFTEEVDGQDNYVLSNITTDSMPQHIPYKVWIREQ